MINNLFNMSDIQSGHLFFDVLLHLATLISILIVYWKDIVSMTYEALAFVNLGPLAGMPRERYPAARMLFMIVMATLPLFLILPIKDMLETLYYHNIFIGIALVLTGCMLYVSDKMTPGKKTERNMTVLDALIIGLCQCVAVVPGLSRSGTTITVTAKATGSATITVNVGADTNYTAPSSKTFTVAVTLVSKTLSSNSWAVIKAVSDAGQGANYWSVGATKSVTINGKVGATTISSLKVDAFIIGFNHNSGKEGSNRIHFLLGKISGKFVGLVDSSYGSTTSTSGAFTMNTSNTNSGGWGSSQMRSKVLGSASSPTSPTANTLLAALPSDLRAVMKSCTKYTDNKGGGNTASNVSSTTDYLFLLSEYEVFATHQYCNDAEPNYQAQYDYFKAGNSKVANKHSATGTAAVWWLRSPTYGYYFCAVSSSGSLDYSTANSAYGVVPGFVV